MGSFIFCVHNHQPVDNFDSVFEDQFERSYLPFLEAMERHPSVKFCAHYSGPLLEWIEKNRLDLFMKVRRMVDQGRLELLAGGFYEPVLPMIPEGDALGQIEMMVAYLRKHFGVEPQGLWLAERVWEPHLPGLLAKSGLKYTVLDDFHFRAAGLRDEELHGRYVTEDRGALFSLFPIKERLRYAIPFHDPQETVDLVRRAPEGSAVVYADDGEKFGGWPNTHAHVYEHGWLEKFLAALEGVKTTTFSEALQAPPRGRIFLPACSYREMGEWALLNQSRSDFAAVQGELRDRGRLDMAKPFLPGGVFRNFLVKYPEANLMYGRMLGVSRRVAESKSRKAREELYRAQCNCGYWHGVFGGLYIPHLRHTVYRHLIAAENEVDRNGAFARMEDLDLDGREEVRLTNPALNLFLSPAQGGQLIGFEVRARGVNLGATLARRPEPYHDAAHPPRYDAVPRASLMDRFLAPGASGAEGAEELGDFVGGAYSVRAGKRGDLLTATLVREGSVSGRVPVRVEKQVTMPSSGGEFQATYSVRAAQPLEAIFAVEFNIAMLNPAAFGAPDRDGVTYRIRDTWHDLDVSIVAAAAAGYWIYPVRTLSKAEGGFESNDQGAAVVPYWRLRLGPDRLWTGTITVRAVPRP